LASRGRRLSEQGRWRAAERILRIALGAAERTSGPRGLDVAAVLVDLGACYACLARFSDAGPAFQRALYIRQDRLGAKHSDVATVFRHLARLEHGAGNYLRGEPFAREALRIRRLALGRDHLEVARDMLALAALLDPQRKFRESERLYERALAILTRELGPIHVEVGVALNNLAAVRQARGRPRQAETLYRRSLVIVGQQQGPDLVEAGFCANNLGALLLARGRFTEAAPLFRRALAIFERALGARHPTVGVCLENYGEVLGRLGRREQAAACARRAAAIRDTIPAVNRDGVAVTATINPLRARFRLMVRASTISRFGVFAEEAIPRGRAVIEYTGERVSRRMGKFRADPDRTYLFGVDRYWGLDGAIGGSGAEFINHRCAPNMGRRVRGGRVTLISVKAIAAGEELTLDYRLAAPIPCRCGAPNCRSRGTSTSDPLRRRAPTRRQRVSRASNRDRPGLLPG